MDCIPAGMELFPSADEEQWAFIKRIIDDCDYYLIIIGGRYGSTTPEGISYTEKEFDYAHEKGIKIIALLHEDPDSLPVNKSDIDPRLREKLDAFRTKVGTSRLVKFWKSAEDLPGIIALSLSKTIKTYPAVGWVRASAVANEDVLRELNHLRKENDQIKSALAAHESTNAPISEELADLDEQVNLSGTNMVREQHRSGYRTLVGRKWKTTLTWRKIFGLIAPYLLNHPTDAVVKELLSTSITDAAGISGTLPRLDDQLYKTVSLQLKALGLVSIDYLGATSGTKALFWALTPKGEALMMQDRVVKRSSD